jgi:ribosomal protein L40E
MSSQPDGVRSAFKVVGPIVAAAGVVLIIFGILDERQAAERRNEQSREFMAGKRDIHDIDNGPSAGFFMIGVGMFAIVIGLGLTVIGFQKSLMRFQLPLVKEALREVAPGLAGGPLRSCPRCRAESPADARFCKQCGGPFASSACSSCGAHNDPDAKFCVSCGKPLQP